MNNSIWRWLIGTIIAIMAIILPIVLSLSSSSYSTSKVSSINGNENIHVVASPGAKVLINKIDPEEHEGETIRRPNWIRNILLEQIIGQLIPSLETNKIDEDIKQYKEERLKLLAGDFGDIIWPPSYPSNPVPKKKQKKTPRVGKEQPEPPKQEKEDKPV